MPIFISNPFFWLFLLSIVLMALPLFIFKFSWFYFYWTLLFILGLFVKVLVHQFFDYPFVEPNGNFSGSTVDWEKYFCWGSLIPLATSITGFVFGFILSGERYGSEIFYKDMPKTKPVIWIWCVIITIVLFAINHVLKIYVIGVNPLYKLPFFLGVPFSFLIYLGSSIMLAVFVANDVTYHQRLRLKISILVLLAIFLLSLLTGSRAPIVIQALPILLGASYMQIRLGKYKISYRPYFYAVIFLFLSLLAVSLFRIYYFYGQSFANSYMIFFYAKESAGLFIDRWTGAEALMTAISYPNASIDTFRQLILESPSKGSSSLYQLISGSYDKYEL